MIYTYCDVEDLTKEWLLGLDLADLVTPNGFTNIYLAMPKGSPLPAITLSRTGGAPDPDSDVPLDIARINFQVWAKSRPTVKEIVKELVSELDNLSLEGGYVSTPIGGRLLKATVINSIWLPDPVSDTPRQIVDARLYVTTL